MTAAASARPAGLLSLGLEALSRAEPKLVPRPRTVAPLRGEEQEAPRHGTSSSIAPLAPLQQPSMAGCADASASDALAELRRLFAAECSLGTSAPGFGVSPPVRSGAANGLVHDSLWRAEAPRACRASLRALQERSEPRALGAKCAGDYRLLVASPDQGLALLAGAVAGEDEGGEGEGDYLGALIDSCSRPPSSASAATGLGAARSMSLPSSRASPVSATWYSGGAGGAHSPSPDLFGY